MRCALASLVLLLGGCSFLQNWNEFRTPGGDAGIGVDAGVGVDAGPDVDGGGGGDGLEGDPCLEPRDCGPGLVCGFGYCAIPCTDDTDCVAAMNGPQCVDGPGGRICDIADAECDPIDPPPTCGPGMMCTLVAGAGSSIVPGCVDVPDPAALIPPGEPCDGGTCTEFHICLDVGRGGPTCERLCFVAPGCDDGRVCGGLSDGMTPLQVFGEDIGVCAGGTGVEGQACMSNDECQLGLICGGGACQRCATDADCPTGQTCNDFDGDMRLECR